MSRWIEGSNNKIILLFLMLSIAAAFSIPAVYAQPEKLVVLMPTPSQYVDPYIKRFEEWYQVQTGKTIKVEHVRISGVACVDHIEEQKGRPREDIVTSLGYDEFERFKKGGFLKPYDSPNREHIPERIGPLVGKDPEYYYTGFSLAAYGIMVNTEVLENENLTAPTGYRDLALNEKYYRRIIMGSPLSTSIAHGNAEVILAHYGWVQGWNVSIHLASLIDRYCITTGTATSLTAEGEYAAVLTKNTYWNEYVEELAFSEYPVEWIWPEEGTAAYILYTGILKGAEQQENAELWIDWMLSEEGQRAWVEFRHETVLRSDIELPAGIPTIEELDIAAKMEPNYDSTVVEQQYDAVTAIWSEKLIGHSSMIQKNYMKKDELNGYLESWILRPMQQAEDALIQAQSTIDIAETTTLTETGQILLEQATIKLSKAVTAFHIAFDHKKAADLASESSSLAQLAVGYVPKPPVWPYYLFMVVALMLGGMATWRLRVERTRAQAQAIYQSRLEVLHTSSTSLVEADSIEQIVAITIEVLRQVLGHTWGEIGFIDGDRFLSFANIHNDASKKFSLPLDSKSVIVRAIKTKETQIVSDTTKDPDYLPPTQARPWTYSELTAPIIIDGEAVGAINLEGLQKNFFTGEDVKLLETLAQHVSSAIGQLQSEKAIRESEKRYKSLFENSLESIVITGPEGNIISCNPAAVTFLGYDGFEELVGRPVVETYAYPEQTVELFKTLIEKGYVEEHELVINKKDGSRAIVSANITLHLDDDGEMIQAESYFRDITEQKEMEEKLKEYSEQLEVKVADRTKELYEANIRLKELDRLKSMFVASMSHELRTPLNSIIGFTGIILMGMAGDITEEQNKQLTIVEKSASHLLDLINDVIDVSKIEAEQVELVIEEFDLSVVLQEVRDAFKVEVDEKGLKLFLGMPERLVVESDRRRTKQIIMNFVSNSVKFTDRGSIEVKAGEMDGTVEISVGDTGIGIKKENMDRLFKQFSRIKVADRPIVEGTGLGLYISKKVADLLGGDIKAESVFGEGSKFTFTLPLKYEEVKT